MLLKWFLLNNGYCTEPSHVLKFIHTTSLSVYIKHKIERLIWPSDYQWLPQTNSIIFPVDTNDILLG